MRHHVVYVIHRQVVALQQFGAIVPHGRHGIAEDGASLLIGEVHAVVHRIVRSGEYGATCLDMQERKPLAISAMDGVHQTDVLLFRAFHHDGTGPIAEKRTGGTILIVGD